jgi:hypothetical protein
MKPDNRKLAALPKPQPDRASRRKLAVAAAAALILLAAMTYWLTRNERATQDIATRTRGALHSTGPADPLAGAGRQSPAPPLPEPGLGMSAGGPQIQGSVSDPAPLSAAASAQHTAENPDTTTASAPPPGVMPQQREDSVIRPAFVRDLARWLVMRYKPARHGGKGQINVSLQAANTRYGMNLRGMERRGRDPAGARAHILRYAFNPAMLEALYGVYADRLVDETARAALAPEQGKALNEAQLDDLYTCCAALFSDLADATGGIAAMPDLTERLESINRANRQVAALYRLITEQVFALDEAREKKDEAAIPGLEARIETLNGRYRAALHGQGNARAALVSAVRNNDRTLLLDDDSILFLALWIQRRLNTQANALDTARKASALLADLSKRFERAGNALQKPDGRRQ